jgi:hypothetical protein
MHIERQSGLCVSVLCALLHSSRRTGRERVRATNRGRTRRYVHSLVALCEQLRRRPGIVPPVDPDDRRGRTVGRDMHMYAAYATHARPGDASRPLGVSLIMLESTPASER